MTETDGSNRQRILSGRPAGIWRRSIATLLDMIVFCALSAALLLPVSRGVDWTSLPTDFDQVARSVSDRGWISHASGVLGIWIAMWWCYFAVGWGLMGGTPGKLMMGLRVVDHRFRYPIGLSRSLLRLVAYTVSSVTLGVGHWLIVFRKDGCALHDLLAGTRVVRRNKSEAICTQPSAVSSPAPPDGDDDRPPDDTLDSKRRIGRDEGRQLKADS